MDPPPVLQVPRLARRPRKHPVSAVICDEAVAIQIESYLPLETDGNFTHLDDHVGCDGALEVRGRLRPAPNAAQEIAHMVIALDQVDFPSFDDRRPE